MYVGEYEVGLLEVEMEDLMISTLSTRNKIELTHDFGMIVSLMLDEQRAEGDLETVLRGLSIPSFDTPIKGSSNIPAFVLQRRSDSSNPGKFDTSLSIVLRRHG